MTPEDYIRHRNVALASGDWRELKKFARQMGYVTVPSDKVIEMSFHQLRTAAVSLPRELRVASANWLRERGYRTWDDGDLAPGQ